MSKSAERQGPVELTRNSIASGNGGDYEAMMAFFGPESTVDMRGVGLGIYAGLPAIRRFFEEWIGSSDLIEFGLEEVQDLGNGVVFASVRQNARPTGAKEFLRLRYAAVYLWVGGVCMLITHYRDFEEARGAAEALAGSRE